MIRRLAVLLCTAVLFPAALCAADNWVLAAAPFEQLSTSRNDGFDEAVRQLPVLILDALSGAGSHLPSEQELLFRQLESLKANRKDLIVKLNAAVTARDAVYISGAQSRTLKKETEKKNAAVSELKLQLDENQEQIDTISHYISQNTLPKDSPDPVPETITLWKNDSRQLLSVPDGMETGAYVTGEKVNGLITGSITGAGNYILVTASLTLYPGSISGASVSVSGSRTELVALAEDIARKLKAAVVNSGTTRLFFSIQPEEIRTGATLVVDDRIIPAASLPAGGLSVEAGFHTVSVEAPGYHTKTFSGDFTGSEAYRISVFLAQEQPKTVHLSMEQSGQGTLYINGLPAGTAPATVKTTGGLLLGEFIPEFPPEQQKSGVLPDTPDEEAIFSDTDTGLTAVVTEPAASLENPAESSAFDEQNMMMDAAITVQTAKLPVQENPVQDSPAEAEESTVSDSTPVSFFTVNVAETGNLSELNARIRAETVDISSRIEKRRRTMYNSYSALLVSLIPTLFSYGMYVNTYNGWAQGYVEPDSVSLWQTVSNGSIILSAGLGINFIVQLGRYIAAVDSVLPESAVIED